MYRLIQEKHNKMYKIQHSWDDVLWTIEQEYAFLDYRQALVTLKQLQEEEATHSESSDYKVVEQPNNIKDFLKVCIIFVIAFTTLLSLTGIIYFIYTLELVWFCTAIIPWVFAIYTIMEFEDLVNKPI